MGLFTSKKLDNMEDLLIDQLQDLYDAEQRLTKAIPKMADAAGSQELKQALQSHLNETERHVDRLEKAFQLIGKDAKTKTCDAMKGLISEGDEVIDADGDSEVKDAALIAAAQRIEHYEISGYGTARAFALQTGHSNVAELLQQTLNEEGAADKKLTSLAEQTINPRAAHQASTEPRR